MSQPLTESETFWTSVIRGGKGRMASDREGWDVLARTYRGSYGSKETVSGEVRPEDDAEEEITHETNYLFGFADTMVASTCPRRPAVTLTPRIRRDRPVTKAREALANEYLKQIRAGKHLRKTVNMAHIYPRAFLKASWSFEDNAPRIRAIRPHKVFFDLAADDWEDVRYVIEVRPITRATFARRVKGPGKRGGLYRADAMKDANFGSYPEWLVSEDRKDRSDAAAVARAAYQWVTVYEVYDFVEKKLWHFLDGDVPALYEGKLPWKYLQNPFYMVQFHDNLEDLGGLSDGQLAFPGIQQLNSLSTLKMWHVKSSIPIGLLNKKYLDDPEAFVTAIQAVDGPGQMVEFETRVDVTGDQLLGWTRSPSLPVDFNGMQDQVRSDTEFVLAMPAHLRGQGGDTDVATQLSLIDTATKTRNGDRQEEVYGAVAWMGVSILSLFAEFIPEDFARDAQVEGKDMTLTPQTLGFFDEEGEAYDFDPKELDVISHPYNAEQVNDVAQFRKLSTVLPYLNASPDVNKRKLTAKLLDFMHMSEILATEEEAAAAAQAAQGAPTAGPSTPAPADIPPDNMPAEAEAPATGGQVAVGTGTPPAAGAAGLGINA